MALNGRMTWIGKDLEASSHDLIIALNYTIKTMKYLSQDSWCPGQIKTQLLSINWDYYLYANPSSFTFMTEINVTVFFARVHETNEYKQRRLSLAILMFHVWNYLTLICDLYRKSTLKVLMKISFLYIPVHVSSNLHEAKIKLYKIKKNCRGKKLVHAKKM
jgi:hypothetical protein